MKVKFAMLELGIDCEMVPVDLTKGQQTQPWFRAMNPFGRVPALVDGDLTLWESHAILAYLGEKTGKLRPPDAAGHAQALKWLFFLSQQSSPPATDLAFNRVAAKLSGRPSDEAAIARREKALLDVIKIIEGNLATSRWMLGADFSLVDCTYGSVLNVIEKRKRNSASRTSPRSKPISTLSAPGQHGRRRPSSRCSRRPRLQRNGLRERLGRLPGTNSLRGVNAIAPGSRPRE